MAHCNIPIFIPHLGCPHQCVFCNQHSISGCADFDEREVPRQIDAALGTLPPDAETEIAFFGGSFTGIDRGLMLRLLELASGYVERGRVSCIRLSTRPDLIDREILDVLRRYPVRTVELGLQSTDDRVLLASRRGHTAAQAEQACREVVNAGFSLVGQMMIGLPGSTPESERKTAEFICRAGAASARIYPTVVFADTPLAKLTENGSYIPLSVSDAVCRAADVLEIFLAHSVQILRIGLCASESLSSPEMAIAGPNHPALGELVWNEVCYRRLYRYLRSVGLLGQTVELTVSERALSKTIGQRRCNLTRLWRETGTEVQKINRVRREGVLSATLRKAN